MPSLSTHKMDRERVDIDIYRERESVYFSERAKHRKFAKCSQSGSGFVE